ncbi:hypothetical protein SAMN05216404_11632 [Nitrosospira multiformis]|uniref:Uncharacterized protein n=1 Tax=Nitrosospira multiformis TaxID=1231 RepID=A0A1H8NFU2_9PROT|nr:hypothetical protein SAMN05216404_11632 [Nitrosospira multiformis]
MTCAVTLIRPLLCYNSSPYGDWGWGGQAVLVPGRQDFMNIELIDIDLHASVVADEASVYASALTMMPVLLTHLFHLFLLGIS